jgi:MarR family transcriptional regulator, organic hydroperoxide resistance regulator
VSGRRTPSARAIRYDKTRLIKLLDTLEDKGLVARETDRADRRVRIVRATPKGVRRHAAVRAAIRAMENELLGKLDLPEQRALLSALGRLADGAVDQISPGR